MFPLPFPLCLYHNPFYRLKQYQLDEQRNSSASEKEKREVQLCLDGIELPIKESWICFFVEKHFTFIKIHLPALNHECRKIRLNFFLYSQSAFQNSIPIHFFLLEAKDFFRQKFISFQQEIFIFIYREKTHHFHKLKCTETLVVTALTVTHSAGGIPPPAKMSHKSLLSGKERLSF